MLSRPLSASDDSRDRGGIVADLVCRIPHPAPRTSTVGQDLGWITERPRRQGPRSSARPERQALLGGASDSAHSPRRLLLAMTAQPLLLLNYGPTIRAGRAALGVPLASQRRSLLACSAGARIFPWTRSSAAFNAPWSHRRLDLWCRDRTSSRHLHRRRHPDTGLERRRVCVLVALCGAGPYSAAVMLSPVDRGPTRPPQLVSRLRWVHRARPPPSSRSGRDYRGGALFARSADPRRAPHLRLVRFGDLAHARAARSRRPTYDPRPRSVCVSAARDALFIPTDDETGARLLGSPACHFSRLAAS